MRRTRASRWADASVRGYAEGFTLGDRARRTNLEWRSRPLNLASAPSGLLRRRRDMVRRAVDYYPSLGVGLRVMIPQLGTRVRAADLAFPLLTLHPGAQASALQLRARSELLASPLRAQPGLASRPAPWPRS